MALIKKKTPFGDVLISKFIRDACELRIEDGRLTVRGENERMKENVIDIFCDDPTTETKFNLSKNERIAVYHVGNIVSNSNLIASQEFRDNIYSAVNKDALGGEMEGGELLRIQKKSGGKIEIIVIKGVADFADSEKTKAWQFVAAKAAFHYVKSKMSAI